MSGERANFDCPDCGSSDVFGVDATDGTYQCRQCGLRTHEKIERHRDTLEESAEDEMAAADVAAVLIGGDER